MAEQQVQTHKVAQISVEEIDEHVVGDQNDVLSLDQDSEEEFSGFESDDVPRKISKEKTIGKTLKSVVKKVTSKDASGEHRLAGAYRSSIFFLKVKGLSFSITKEGGMWGVWWSFGTGDGLGG
ncbi:hypothetical protein DPMN_127498 [Dreissena polymorpha]|uniref:Uncharacterized protein n=1 Tax=Dreissena polymorpha TaxID=45954 RepID=A0A9D4H5C0_DREPO|nr:hypothetical protein DPMN_127498 [Dreissena polymorpha]